jgi:hypothetical protein
MVSLTGCLINDIDEAHGILRPKCAQVLKVRAILDQSHMR